MNSATCLICDSEVVPFLCLEDVPVFCNVLHSSREAALSASRAVLDLVICRKCGHIFNQAFNESLMDYDPSYENSLHVSPRFQSYATELAAELVSRFSLQGDHVMEIACGQGDFLDLLCQAGAKQGTGFDPGFRGEAASTSVKVLSEYFGVRDLGVEAGLVCCRHALEHMADPVAFMQQVKAALPSGGGTPLFFEVPNSLYSLRDGGVWDFIYEHVSYFCGRSLSACFRRAGLDVGETRETFEGQFLCVYGSDKLSNHEIQPQLSPVPTESELMALARDLAGDFNNLTRLWRKKISKIGDTGGKVAVWGTGSKGVSFLNQLGEAAAKCVPVDINPLKHGQFVAGTGSMVVSPADLVAIKPTMVLVMNPVYIDEVNEILVNTGVTAQVTGIGS